MLQYARRYARDKKLGVMKMLASRSSRVLRPWQLAGIVAFLPHLLAVVMATVQRPEFSHRLQYLSELGERGSVTATLTNYLGIIPTGILFASFGLGLVLHYRAHRLLTIAGALIILHGLCRVLAALFPCEFGCRPSSPTLSQMIHNSSATVAFVSLTASLFMAGPWLVANKRGAAIVAATYLLGLMAVAAQVVLITSPAASPGLFQRLALGALQLWVTLLALHLVGHARAGRNDASQETPSK